MNYVIILSQLDSFMKSRERNRWLNDGVIKIYVRKSTRIFNGAIYNCLDLASVEILNEKDREKGFFTNFLKELLKLYSTTNIFVESILNPKLESILKKFYFESQKLEEFQLNMFLIQEK